MTISHNLTNQQNTFINSSIFLTNQNTINLSTQQLSPHLTSIYQNIKTSFSSNIISSNNTTHQHPSTLILTTFLFKTLRKSPSTTTIIITISTLFHQISSSTTAIIWLSKSHISTFVGAIRVVLWA